MTEQIDALDLQLEFGFRQYLKTVSDAELMNILYESSDYSPRLIKAVVDEIRTRKHPLDC